MAIFRGIRGCQRCRGFRGVLEVSRDCRYSGARRGMGASAGIGAPRGCRELLGGVRGVLGADRDCRYSGARRGIRSTRGHWGHLG